MSAAAAPARAAELRPGRFVEAVRRAFLEPETPTVAVEVRPTAVGIVRARREHGHPVLVAASSVDLPAGVLTLKMTHPNVADPVRFRAALRAAMERAGVLDGARAALVLPDPVARVALLPAEEVKARRHAQQDEMIRFRLKKGVPFEIREARLAHVWGRAGQPVVAVAAPAAILDEYEAACRDVRLEPGQVEIAGLALTRTALRDAAGDRLLVNWDDGYVSFALLRDGWPALFRTLPGPVAASPEEVAREAGQTLLYARERLGGTALAEAVVRCTQADPASALAVLAEALGRAPRLLGGWAGPAGAAASVGQGLAGAVSVVGVRA